MTLPADVARCAGYWADGEMREGCDDCQRRTAGHPPGNRTVWMAPPLLVVFECEARIAPNVRASLTKGAADEAWKSHGAACPFGSG